MIMELFDKLLRKTVTTANETLGDLVDLEFTDIFWVHKKSLYQNDKILVDHNTDEFTVDKNRHLITFTLANKFGVKTHPRVTYAIKYMCILGTDLAEIYLVPKTGGGRGRGGYSYKVDCGRAKPIHPDGEKKKK